ncbi:MAG: HAMP domain-containing protein [Ignavibacteriales bacterium]|nr:HAMP domain-containing protein [Ignavibacteriales bacterium]
MQKKSYRNKIYIVLFTFFILTIILYKVLEPIIINNTKNNWDNLIIEKNNKIEEEVIELFIENENNLLNTSKEIKSKIKKSIPQNDIISILTEINSHDYSDYSVLLFDDKKNLIGWSKNGFINNADTLLDNYNFGETHFLHTDLIIYLSVTDTIHSNNTNSYLLISLPFEKDYIINNKYYKKISFSQKLIDKFHTAFEVNYSSEATYSNDGRYFSFSLLNNFKNKIAVVTFQKYFLDTEIDSLHNLFLILTSISMVFLVIILGLFLLKYLRNLKQNYIKFTFIALYISIVRIVLFLLGIPSRYIQNELTDSAYFSSVFAGGMIRSPLEFFITSTAVLLITVLAFKYILSYVDKRYELKNKRIIISISISTICIVIYFILYRSIGATINSIVFDSTLLYFRDSALIPELPNAIMHANILIIGFSFILFSIAFICVISSQLFFLPKKNQIFYFITLFFIIQTIGFLYDYFQSEPQATDFIRLTFIAATFVISYLIIILRHKKAINYIYIAFAASVITISLLIHYNYELEKKSLRITALDITRPNENLFEFLVTETLVNAMENQQIKEAFKKSNFNYSALAFKTWSRSGLQQESYNSEYNFLDKNTFYLGGFDFRFKEKYWADWSKVPKPIDTVIIYKQQLPNSGSKIIHGLAPIKDKDNLLGHVEVSILYEITSIGFEETPDFLLTPRAMMNTTVDYNDLNIIDFSNDTISTVLGDIPITVREKEMILNADFNQYNEAWLNLRINNNEYIIFILKILEENKNRVLAISLRQKDFYWNLFNFFKVFFLHSCIITLIIFLYLFIKIIRYRKIAFSFKTQLLFSFIIISIIPLLLLAIYFSNLTDVKNNESILYKLIKRAKNIEFYINDYLLHSPATQNELYGEATRDLNINYSVYNGQFVEYNSKQNFMNIGLIPSIVNPEAFNEIVYKKQNYWLTNEEIENYTYTSLFYNATLANKPYIIKIDDAFNKISIPMSQTEVNVFLFGTYSLAIIFIIILSTILSDRISLPIRKLTAATKTVASGDLNFELVLKSKSELQDLIDGFNLMLKDLQKNQYDLADMEREIAWKEMAKQVAHEIKNPLTPMKLSVQHLIAVYRDKSPKFDEAFEKVTKTIINQIETLNNIASEFSAFAKMPSIKVEKVDLVLAIREVVDLFTEEKVKIKFDYNKESKIEADYDHLKRTLINIIRNSVQAKADLIEIFIEENIYNYSLRIKDNGVGIPPEIINKVFEINFTTKEKGMGLGLSMAKKFITNINGKISIESSSSQGTVILIVLPKAI